jgi:hypothetical protein
VRDRDPHGIEWILKCAFPVGELDRTLRRYDLALWNSLPKIAPQETANSRPPASSRSISKAAWYDCLFGEVRMIILDNK